MKWPTPGEMLFSGKSYLAAMLALYLAYSIDLPRPFWAATTAYVVVTQPWVGSVRSKALYRLCGTFVGSAATVFMVPRLSQSPELLTLAMASWLGICLYISLLDRTPRSYVFMLAGYTAALIGFPSVVQPADVFNTAVARVEEISLGIVCATFIHSVILPKGIRPVVMAGLDRSLTDARAWMGDVLRGIDIGTRAKDRGLLANDITQLRLLSTHVPFEVDNLRWSAQTLRALQNRIVALTPLISAVEDRVRAFQSDGRELPGDLRLVMSDLAQWVEAGADAFPEPLREIRETLSRILAAIPPRPDWHDMLAASLATRLRELAKTYAQCLRLRRLIDAGRPADEKRVVRHNAARVVLHRDRGLALLSGAAAAIAIVECCALWILTGWKDGATAAMMAAVFSCLFSVMDNPVPFIRRFFVFTVLSAPLSALYLLVILPTVNSFEMLVLVLFPSFFVIGCLIHRPAIALQVTAVLFGLLGALALQDAHSADLISFTNSIIGQLAGTGLAAVNAAIFRTISAERAAGRIQKANRRDLATLAGLDRLARTNSFTARILDRIGLLQSRLAITQQPDDAGASDAMLDLRVGADIALLQRVKLHLAPESGKKIQHVLDELAAYFQGGSKQRDRAAGVLLKKVDSALADVAGMSASGAPKGRAMVALVGIRRGLFPQAMAYEAGAGQMQMRMQSS